MKKKKKYPADHITACAWVLWFISGSAVDSESWIPLIVFGFSTLWLLLDAHVRESRQKRRRAAHGNRRPHNRQRALRQPA